MKGGDKRKKEGEQRELPPLDSWKKSLSSTGKKVSTGGKTRVGKRLDNGRREGIVGRNLLLRKKRDCEQEKKGRRTIHSCRRKHRRQCVPAGGRKSSIGMNNWSGGRLKSAEDKVGSATIGGEKGFGGGERGDPREGHQFARKGIVPYGNRWKTEATENGRGNNNQPRIVRKKDQNME